MGETTNRILLDNVIEAWRTALDAYNAIISGRVTLRNKKQFVSSLHNVTELFIKQIMLDKCDYRVANTAYNADGTPLKAYFKSDDLNEFFANLTKEARRKFKTIEYSKIIEKHKSVIPEFLNSLLDEEKKEFDNGLRVLKNTRNDETHFCIKNNDFLIESEFKVLVEFTKLLEQGLRYYHIFDDADDYNLLFEYELLPERFSYKLFLKRCDLIQNLNPLLNGTEFIYPLSKYDIAKSFSSVIQPEGISNIEFDRLYSYVIALSEFNAIKIEKALISLENGDGDPLIIPGVKYRIEL